MSKTVSSDVKTVSEKMDELSQIVAWFESDEFELEAALEKYRTAEGLAGEIEHDLANLKNEVTVLKKKFDA